MTKSFSVAILLQIENVRIFLHRIHKYLIFLSEFFCLLRFLFQFLRCNLMLENVIYEFILFYCVLFVKIVCGDSVFIILKKMLFFYIIYHHTYLSLLLLLLFHYYLDYYYYHHQRESISYSLASSFLLPFYIIYFISPLPPVCWSISA